MDDFIKLLKTFPRKRIAVGLLLFNSNDELLLLKPGYKELWTLPGGVVEENESLVDAALRETKEEIGIDIKVANCLAVDYSQKQLKDYLDESLQVLFLGNVLTDNNIGGIKIDNDEIIDYKFVKINKAIAMLNEHLSGRLQTLNGDYTKFVLMENGKAIL